MLEEEVPLNFQGFSVKFKMGYFCWQTWAHFDSQEVLLLMLLTETQDVVPSISGITQKRMGYTWSIT